MADMWVFGYGSLMWRPGFPFVESQPARIKGVHRALCVYSWVHRGTRERPGLVLGLDRGGSCRGIAFRIRAVDAGSVINYLRGREQVTGVYLEQRRALVLEDERELDALTFVVDRAHDQYAGRLDADAEFEIVRQAHGRSGSNRDYVVRTVEHLIDLGIGDHRLQALADRLTAAPE